MNPDPIPVEVALRCLAEVAEAARQIPAESQTPRLQNALAALVGYGNDGLSSRGFGQESEGAFSSP